jgi:hypothetical protein
MEDLGMWATPLVLLPGVALLVLSTSIRFGQLHEEIHQLGEQPSERLSQSAAHLLLRARLFRNALVSLYVSVSLLAAASLLGGIINVWWGQGKWVLLVLTALGVAGLLVAAVLLIRESWALVDVIRDHGRQIARRSRPTPDSPRTSTG